MPSIAAQPHSARPRLFRRLAVCVMLGIITNLGIAWYAGIDRSNNWMVSGEPLGWSFIPNTNSKWRFWIASNWCRTTVETYRDRLEWPGVPSAPRGFVRPSFDPANPQLISPPWSIAAQIVSDPKDKHLLARYIEDIAYGWPFRAARSRLAILDNDKETLHFAFHLGPRFDGIIIAYKPIPLGFAANTLIFAAAFAVPLVALPALRRRLRARRMRCPSCNYDLRGLPTPTCPECGWIASTP